jgi:ribonuclease PH
MAAASSSASKVTRGGAKVDHMTTEDEKKEVRVPLTVVGSGNDLLCAGRDAGAAHEAQGGCQGA